MKPADSTHVLVIDDDEAVAALVGALAAPFAAEVLHTYGEPFACASRRAIDHVTTRPGLRGVLVRADLAAGGERLERAAFHGVSVLREIRTALAAPPPAALYGCVAPHPAVAGPGGDVPFLDLLGNSEAVSSWLQSVLARPEADDAPTLLTGVAAADLRRLRACFETVRPALEHALRAESGAGAPGVTALEDVFASRGWWELAEACASVLRPARPNAQMASALREAGLAIQALGAIRWALEGAGADGDQRQSTAKDGLTRIAACGVLLDHFTDEPKQA
jgi:hypothetical protein